MAIENLDWLTGWTIVCRKTVPLRGRTRWVRKLNRVGKFLVIVNNNTILSSIAKLLGNGVGYASMLLLLYSSLAINKTAFVVWQKSSWRFGNILWALLTVLCFHISDRKLWLTILAFSISGAVMPFAIVPIYADVYST